MNPMLLQLVMAAMSQMVPIQLDGSEQPNVSDRHSQAFELADSAGATVDPFRD